jgi:hypothetical protein
MEPLAATSARRLARIAGILYLVNITVGAFAIGVVPALLSGADPAATAHRIQAHELLFRSGVAAHILVTLTNIPMAVIFYELFRVVNRRLAQLDLCFILVGTAVEAAGLLNQLAPLALLNSDHTTGALSTAQLQALTALSGNLSTTDYDVYTVFYGLDLVCLGYLILRSGLLPRTIGVLVIVDGLAYPTYGFADLLAPGFAHHLVPWIQAAPILGEGSLCIWLIVAGINTARWPLQQVAPGPAETVGLAETAGPAGTAGPAETAGTAAGRVSCGG